MPVTMSGMASGVDTADMVKKLVEIERAPIYRMQQSEKEIQYENEALLELRRRAKILQDSLKVLSGFEAAFEQKTLGSTPAGHIEGIANKKAIEGTHKIELLSLASSLSFSSKGLDPKTTVPAGRLSFDGKSADFKGGTLGDFRDFLNKNFSDLLSAKTVSIRENESVIIIDSKKTGSDSLLKIDDSGGILHALDMYKAGADVPLPPQAAEPQENKPPDTPPSQPSATLQTEAKLFNETELKAQTPGNFQTRELGKILWLDSNARVRLEALPVQNENTTLKTIRLKSAGQQTEVQEPAAGKPPEKAYLEEGPVKSITIKGIELQTYTIGRERLSETLGEQQPPDEKADFGIIVHTAGGSEVISLKEAPQDFSYQPRQPVKALEFFATKMSANFSELAFELEKTVPAPEPVSQDKRKELEQKRSEPDFQQQIFPHLIRPARNARLKLNGVMLERPGNTDLKDIIEGTSLNLLKALPGEEIELHITANNPKALEQVKNFIKAYNDLMLYAQEASKSAEIKDTGKFNEMKSNQGILVTNATVRSLVQGLKIQVSNPYPAVREPNYRTLASIGITTGEIGAKWEEISKGYLELDEKKLLEALANHPLAVKELFVLDTNADNRPDNGFAYTTDKFLDPYTRITGGVITAQINNNNERLKQIAREIKKTEDHAKAYENKLKQRFGYMESNVAKQKATGKFLQERLGNNKQE